MVISRGNGVEIVVFQGLFVLRTFHEFRHRILMVVSTDFITKMGSRGAASYTSHELED